MPAASGGSRCSLPVTDDSSMATGKQVERRIEKIEGFRVQILHGRDHRFSKHYPGFEVQVLDASGHVAHGGTLLTTVRDTYLDG